MVLYCVGALMSFVFSSLRNLGDALHRIAQLIQDEECVSVQPPPRAPHASC